MTNEQIKKIFLLNGFKEKQQPNGEVDLNPYVYEAARALLKAELIAIQDEMFALTTESYKTGSNPMLEQCDAIIDSHLREIEE